jgi:uracil-DNA glycosylase
MTRDYLEYQVHQGLTYVMVLPTKPEKVTAEVMAPSPLEEVRQELGECTRCPLHQSRTRIVFGEGDPHAGIMFIGEGPGAEEDREGKPFVGRAGQLLTRMIKAMGLERSQVYIANVVKCRPPANRDPAPLEIATCLPFLEAQISAVRPRVIVAVGRISTGALLNSSTPLAGLRGRFHDRKGIPVMPTYHPAFLLRQERERRFKADAWADLKQVMALMEVPLSKPGDKP